MSALRILSEEGSALRTLSEEASALRIQKAAGAGGWSVQPRPFLLLLLLTSPVPGVTAPHLPTHPLRLNYAEITFLPI